MGRVSIFVRKQVIQTPNRAANPKVLAPLNLQDLQWVSLFEEKTAMDKPGDLPIFMFMKEAGAKIAFKCVQWTMGVVIVI